jgi:hypothetical protein
VDAVRAVADARLDLVEQRDVLLSHRRRDLALVARPLRDVRHDVQVLDVLLLRGEIRDLGEVRREERLASDLGRDPPGQPSAPLFCSAHA